MRTQNINNSNIRDHLAQVTITNITVVRKSNTLQELPYRDTDTWSEQMLLEKMTLVDLVGSRLPRAFVKKKKATLNKSPSVCRLQIKPHTTKQGCACIDLLEISMIEVSEIKLTCAPWFLPQAWVCLTENSNRGKGRYQRSIFSSVLVVLGGALQS